MEESKEKEQKRTLKRKKNFFHYADVKIIIIVLYNCFNHATNTYSARRTTPKPEIFLNILNKDRHFFSFCLVDVLCTFRSFHCCCCRCFSSMNRVLCSRCLFTVRCAILSPKSYAWRYENCRTLDCHNH